MKRHAALIPLSHDHQHALAAALRLRRCTEHDQTAESLDALRAEVRSFLDFAERELWNHLREEEHELAPLLEEQPDVFAQLWEQLNKDHALLRQAISALQSELTTVDSNRLFDRAEYAARLLHDHVRWEERELFERMQEYAAEQLDGLTIPARSRTSPATHAD